jgi:hypothetical protein
MAFIGQQAPGLASSHRSLLLTLARPIVSGIAGSVSKGGAVSIVIGTYTLFTIAAIV